MASHSIERLAVIVFSHAMPKSYKVYTIFPNQHLSTNQFKTFETKSQTHNATNCGSAFNFTNLQYALAGYGCPTRILPHTTSSTIPLHSPMFGRTNADLRRRRRQHKHGKSRLCHRRAAPSPDGPVPKPSTSRFQRVAINAETQYAHIFDRMSSGCCCLYEAESCVVCALRVRLVRSVSNIIKM